MTTPLQDKLRTDRIAVGNEVSNLWLHHDIFWKIGDAFNNNEQVQETGGHLIESSEVQQGESFMSLSASSFLKALKFGTGCAGGCLNSSAR